MKLRPSFSSTIATLSWQRHTRTPLQAQALYSVQVCTPIASPAAPDDPKCWCRRTLTPRLDERAALSARAAIHCQEHGARVPQPHTRMRRCGTVLRLRTSISLASYLVLYGVASSFGRSDTCAQHQQVSQSHRASAWRRRSAPSLA
jgi:hypothetical protein